MIVMGVDKRFIGIHVDVGGSPLEIEAMPGSNVIKFVYFEQT